MTRSIGALRALAICMLVLVLVGCAAGRTTQQESYTVKPGDTLSEIGQRLNINWHDLARWNHIPPPYRIQVGEKLALKRFPKLDYAHMPSNAGNQSAPAKRSEQKPEPSPPPTGRIHALPQRSLPTVQSGSSGSRTAASSGQRSQSGASSQNVSAAQNKSAPAKSAPKSTKPSAAANQPSRNGWEWPTRGALVHGYDAHDGQRGIEIGGKVGAPIRAASSGTVVYNGIGLKGYGKLIIIKHKAHYLSAYGFNKKSLVKQGETVAEGQHIADMGLGPGNKPMLHFEIRRDGDPLNPLKILPKR